ncbi:MAG: pepsin/retropepsin-like aspartic protease family protein [Steroidobacteraceae bacterium]
MRAAASVAAAAWLLVGSAVAGEAAYPLSLTRGSRLMIAASINGHPVHALLDSAAEATLIDSGFAKQLALHSSSVARGQGSGKDSFEAGMAPGVQLQALGLTLPNQTVAIVDLADVGHRLLGRRLDCILGREIFDAARLWIDIDGRRLRVLSRDAEPAGVRLQLVTQNGIETLPVRVEGEAARAAFDLGNGNGLLIGAKFADRMHLLTDGRPVSKARGGGLGGETTRQMLRLRSLEVAGQVYTNVAAAIDAQPSATEVNIGVNVLRHFFITADFPNHVLWLEPRR